MRTPSITLTRADSEDIEWLEGLLESNGLPAEDLRTGAGRFFVARAGTERVGGGGLEVHGLNGLLRSVVVAEPKRGEGFGTALRAALEDRARTNGIETLYLLTTTAAAFFEAHGYDRIDRETAPPGIRATTEFAERCPSAAVCLRKQLGR